VRSRRFATLALAAVATLVVSFAAVALGASGSTLLVSPPNDPTAPSRPTEHFNPAISADGRFVAYVGTVSSAGDPDGSGGPGPTGTGIFLRDMSGGTTAVDVPFGTSEQGLGFEAGAPSLSDNGRFLAFASEDPDLSDEDRDSSTTLAGDTFPVRDIFVYDRLGGQARLASRTDGRRGTGGNEDSSNPSISADGRFVAFQTNATNILRGSFGGVFLRDLDTGTTVPVARVSYRAGGRFDGGYTPSVSAHGRRVAFLTVAHLRHGHALEVAVRDMRRRRTFFVSRAEGRRGRLGNGDCKLPAISANGRYVAFASEASNLSPIDKGSIEDVFVRDLKTDRTILVSRAGGKRGAAGDGDSSNPSISANGRFVAFESDAANLGPADDNEDPDIFVRDMRSGRVTLVSRADGGGARSNAPSANPAISADGRYVAFESRGSNLNPADTLRLTSVFRYQLLP
jgi:Tol biopolymer transport system component